MVPGQQLAPQLRALAEGYVYLNGGKYREALAAWSKEPPATLSDVDRLVRARARAELGEADYAKLLAPIEAKYPAESATTHATYYWNQKDTAQAAAALERVYESLSRGPWAITSSVHPALALTTKVANADRAAARRFFDLLAKPFAGNRFEHQRTLLRLMVAESLGQAFVL